MYTNRARISYGGQGSSITVKEAFFPLNWNPPPASSVTMNFAVPPYVASYEKIRSDDELKNKKVWKSCEHYKIHTLPVRNPLGFPWVTNHSSATSRRYYGTCPDPILGYVDASGYKLLPEGTVVGSGQRFGEFGNHIAGLPQWYSVRSDGGFVNPPDNLDYLIDKALKVMLPGIKAELSIINSIIELKDFRNLPNTLHSIGSFASKFGRSITGRFNSALPSFMQRVRRSFGSGSGPTAREALGTSADGYLSAEFAILPFLSDVVGLGAALARVERQVNSLVSRAGGRQVRHFAYNSTLPDVSHEHTNCYALNSGQFAGSEHPPGYTGCLRKHLHTFKAMRNTGYDTSEFHAQIEYNYNFTRYIREHAHIYGLMDSIGWNLNPAIIWNAIPWSFLVDWVGNIGRWLDDRKTLNLEPKINMIQFLWSERKGRKVRLSIKGCPINAPKDPKVPRTYLPLLRETSYRRQVGLPDESSFTTSGLSSKEISLGAALVVTRRRFRYRQG